MYKNFQKLFAVINIAILFFSGLNPARVTSLISRNTSLFTLGLSWNTLTNNLGRAFDKGWIEKSDIILLFLMCMVMIIAGVLFGCYVCMMLGNKRFQYLAYILAAIGGFIELIASAGIYIVYTHIILSEQLNKIEPLEPVSLWLYAGLGLAMLIMSGIGLLTCRRQVIEKDYYMDAKYRLFIMYIPVIVLAFLFSYLPLYGWRYAFFDYKAGLTLNWDDFVGFKWFIQFFKNDATRNDIIHVLRNTLVMSFLGLATSWLPMFFAIMLTQIKSRRFRQLVQTFTTIPNFISWVLVYAIALAIFSTDGFVNTFLTEITGNVHNTNYLMSSNYTWLKMLAWGVWKSLGWNAIVYIAAISGLDQQLFEAADIDGANRFQKIRYITIPGLLPTYFVLLLMSVANILSNGMDQYLVFFNAVNEDTIEVLDLYVYHRGIGSGAIPLSTAIGIFKSVISITLLMCTNRFSKAVRGESII